MLLSQGLELCHGGGNSLLTLCRVDDVDDLIVGGNLSHTFAPPFGQMALTFCESKDITYGT